MNKPLDERLEAIKESYDDAHTTIFATLGRRYIEGIEADRYQAMHSDMNTKSNLLLSPSEECGNKGDQLDQMDELTKSVLIDKAVTAFILPSLGAYAKLEANNDVIVTKTYWIRRLFEIKETHEIAGPLDKQEKEVLLFAKGKIINLFMKYLEGATYTRCTRLEDPNDLK
jgi:hypothetical protein